MKEQEILKDIMTKQDIGITQLAARTSLSKQTVWNKVNRLEQNGRAVSLNIDSLNQLLRAMDYKIQIVPASARTPEGGYTVE